MKKVIYVKEEDDNDGKILIAEESIEELDADNGQKVGIYELVAVKKMKVKTTLE